MAELSDRPFPPGSYPVIVVGSGPGGLQVSYCLDAVRGASTPCCRPTTRRAACSAAGRSSSGCCRGRSRSRPVAHADPAYQRYDWNSLLADEPENQAIMPGLMDGDVLLPVASGDAGRTSRRSPSGPGSRSATAAAGRAPGARRRRRHDGVRPRDDRRRVPAPTVVFAVGVAEPYRAGHAGHRARRPLRRRPARPRPTPTSGSSSSASRTPASSSRRGCSSGRAAIVLASPSPAKLSVNTNSLVGVRARYVQPFEDHVLGGGVAILDAAIGRIGRLDGGDVRGHRPADRRRRRASRSRSTRSSRRPASSRRSSTCRTSGSRRSARAGCRRRRRTGRACRCPASSSPARSPRARRASRSTACRRTPGPSTARATTRGCWPGTSRRHGSASRRRSSGRRSQPARRRLPRRRACRRRPSCSTSGRTSRGSSRWTQPTGPRDEGVVPLAAFVDATGDDATAMRSRSRSRPTAPARSTRSSTHGAGPSFDEAMFDPDPLLRYDTPAVRERLAALVATSASTSMGTDCLP